MSPVLLIVIVLTISLIIAVWVNAKVCGEPSAKKLLCRLGFHNYLIDSNDRLGTLKCVDCPRVEVVDFVE